MKTKRKNLVNMIQDDKKEDKKVFGKVSIIICIVIVFMISFAFSSLYYNNQYVGKSLTIAFIASIISLMIITYSPNKKKQSFLDGDEDCL